MPDTIFDQYKDITEQLKNTESDLLYAQSDFKSVEYNTKGSVSSEQLAFFLDKKEGLVKLTRQVDALKTKQQELKTAILDFFKSNTQVTEVLIKNKDYPSLVPTAIKPVNDFTDITCMSRLG